MQRKQDPMAKEAAPLNVLLMSGSLDGGGSERQTLLLAKHLDRRRFRPVLYLRHRQGVLLADVPADVPILSFDDAAPAPRPHWPGRIGAHHTRYLHGLLGQHAIDVVYDRTFQMTMAVAPAAAALRIPRVSTVVSPPDRMLPRLEPRFQRLKRRRLARAYAASRQVVAVSDAVAAAAARFYRLSTEKIVTIRNPIDVAETLRRAAEPLSRGAGPLTHVDGPLTHGDAAVHFVCIGRMSQEKGQAVLLDALRQVHSQRPELAWRLTLVGDGPDRQRLAERCRSQGWSERVRFTGHLENPLPLLKAADALVLPSLFEGLPNVVLEAMCLATPVIATSGGGTGELLDGGRLGQLVPPGDAAALAEALLRWIEHRGGRVVEQQRRAATEAVRTQYSLSAVLPRMADLLARAAEGN
ncbi:glycosyltransferase [Roseimaritima sediminicola]|uniref:glycosyltransferase n=1 Tax=Roseimaritima sediminicola TaxID=2662066 RepID=UPI00129840E7|nr:glycosyltransferase [Roseimaritima sediminicola]